MLHPGSHVDAGVDAGIAQIVKGLNMVLDADDNDVYIALETMAGKGSEVGRTFEELKRIYDGVERKDRLRICFDTCHVSDAGYPLVTDYEGVLKQLSLIHIFFFIILLTVSIVPLQSFFSAIHAVSSPLTTSHANILSRL